MLERVLLGFLVIRKMGFLIFPRQFLGSFPGCTFRGSALRLVGAQIGGRIKVAATGIAAELTGIGTRWCRHEYLVLKDAFSRALFLVLHDVAVT